MGFIYLINIKGSDLYKVGTTKRSVEKRMKSLQTGSPFAITYVDSFESELYKKIETIMHRSWKYKKYLLDDFTSLPGEWFKLSGDDVSEFKHRCQNIHESILYIKKNSTMDVTKI